MKIKKDFTEAFERYNKLSTPSKEMLSFMNLIHSKLVFTDMDIDKASKAVLEDIEVFENKEKESE